MTWSREPDRYRGVTRAQADRIRVRDGHTCRKCGAYGREVDHIIPVSQGGTNHDANLQVLCGDCHMVKTQVEAAAGRAKVSRYREVEEHPGRIGRQGASAAKRSPVTAMNLARE